VTGRGGGRNASVRSRWLKKNVLIAGARAKGKEKEEEEGPLFIHEHPRGEEGGVEGARGGGGGRGTAPLAPMWPRVGLEGATPTRPDPMTARLRRATVQPFTEKRVDLHAGA